MTNYFDSKDTAKRYKIGRPNFHLLIVEKLQEILNLKARLNNCLDVGCGTGLSTIPLLKISEKAVGIDTSFEMLRQAERNPKVVYKELAAEKISELGMDFDMVVTSSVFHWLDQKAFLQECHKVLKVNGFVVVHNNFFTGTTTDYKSDDFKEWLTERYLQRYVTPKRNNYQLEEEEIKALGFEITHNERFENTIFWTKEALVNYLITQSNVIANLEMGTYSIEDVTEWLMGELRLHFNEMDQREFVYANRLILLQKIS